MSKPGVAGVLSLVVPGVGQIYNGAFLRGIFWLIVTPGLWLGSGGFLGWVCHLLAAYTAYNYAERQLTALGPGRAAPRAPSGFRLQPERARRSV